MAKLIQQFRNALLGDSLILHDAIRKGDFAGVQSFLKKHRGACTRNLLQSINNKDALLSPICFAAYYGRLAIIKELMKAGAPADHTFEKRKTALCAAYEEGYEHIAEYLIEQGANIHFVSSQNENMLNYATKGYCRTSTLQKMLDMGILPTNTVTDNASTSLMNTVVRGHHEGMQLILQSGACANEACFHEITAHIIHTTLTPETPIPKTYQSMPLMMAAAIGDIKAAEQLLEYRANINALDERGWPALAYAAHREKTDMMTYLLYRGANVNLLPKDGSCETEKVFAVAEAKREADVEKEIAVLHSGTSSDITAAKRLRLQKPHPAKVTAYT